MKHLTDLPAHMQTLAWIEDEIAHEQHQGVHTYHACECGAPCRSSMCVKCWQRILTEHEALGEQEGQG